MLMAVRGTFMILQTLPGGKAFSIPVINFSLTTDWFEKKNSALKEYS